MKRLIPLLLITSFALALPVSSVMLGLHPVE